ncbi:hypothetical protein CN918_26510 [Priestia megaterium]|nr:hypothetical protein CN918_26510 [Priestia megaterium]
MAHVAEEMNKEKKVICNGLGLEGCGSIVGEDNGNFELKLCYSCNETLLNEEGYKTCRKCIKTVDIKDGGEDSDVCQFCQDNYK